MEKYVIPVCLALLLLHVRSELLFDEYAESTKTSNYKIYEVWFVQGPFQQKPMGSEECRITGTRCIGGHFTRRKLPGPANDWLYNVSVRTYLYMRETTTVQVVASTKGASGHYNSLADITRPACKWLDWIRPFTKDLCEHAGYNPDSCLSVFPGWFEINSFHVKAQSHFRFAAIPILPYGLYKIEFHVHEKDNKNCYCMRVYMNIIPDVKTIVKKQNNITMYGP